MNIKIHRRKITDDTKMCVLLGLYDEDGQYCERHIEDVPFCHLPKFVCEGINPSYDVSILIFPRKGFLAFYKQTPKNLVTPHNAAIMKFLFESYADYSIPDDHFLWTAGNFHI